MIKITQLPHNCFRVERTVSDENFEKTVQGLFEALMIAVLTYDNDIIYYSDDRLYYDNNLYELWDILQSGYLAKSCNLTSFKPIEKELWIHKCEGTLNYRNGSWHVDDNTRYYFTSSNINFYWRRYDSLIGLINYDSLIGLINYLREIFDPSYVNIFVSEECKQEFLKEFDADDEFFLEELISYTPEHLLKCYHSCKLKENRIQY